MAILVEQATTCEDALLGIQVLHHIFKSNEHEEFRAVISLLQKFGKGNSVVAEEGCRAVKDFSTYINAHPKSGAVAEVED